MLTAGLDGFAASNTKCFSHIKVYGDKRKLTEAQLCDLKVRFTKRMSHLLELNNPSVVDVRFIKEGCIAIFFLLPLQASLRLWECWRDHPRRVQKAMRGLVYSPDYPDDRIPVLSVGSTLGIDELRLINEYRSEKKEATTESSMLRFHEAVYFQISFIVFYFCLLKNAWELT